jgi:glycerol 3-phosphatase-1
VTGWLEVLKLTQPRHLVVAEDVEKGKPDPDCYLLGRSKLGLPAGAAVLVIEDAPAGVRAGKAAGCKVIGLATTHDLRLIKEAGADWIVKDLTSVRLKGWDEKTREVEVEISNALQD